MTTIYLSYSLSHKSNILKIILDKTFSTESTNMGELRHSKPLATDNTH